MTNPPRALFALGALFAAACLAFSSAPPVFALSINTPDLHLTLSF